MCEKVACNKCNKWTWKGCGNHVKEVLRGVPKSKLCACRKSHAPKNSRVVKRNK